MATITDRAGGGGGRGGTHSIVRDSMTREEHQQWKTMLHWNLIFQAIVCGGLCVGGATFVTSHDGLSLGGTFWPYLPLVFVVALTYGALWKLRFAESQIYISLPFRLIGIGTTITGAVIDGLAAEMIDDTSFSDCNYTAAGGLVSCLPSLDSCSMTVPDQTCYCCKIFVSLERDLCTDFSDNMTGTLSSGEYSKNVRYYYPGMDSCENVETLVDLYRSCMAVCLVVAVMIVYHSAASVRFLTTMKGVKIRQRHRGTSRTQTIHISSIGDSSSQRRNHHTIITTSFGLPGYSPNTVSPAHITTAVAPTSEIPPYYLSPPAYSAAPTPAPPYQSPPPFDVSGPPSYSASANGRTVHTWSIPQATSSDAPDDIETLRQQAAAELMEDSTGEHRGHDDEQDLGESLNTAATAGIMRMGEYLSAGALMARTLSRLRNVRSTNDDIMSSSERPGRRAERSRLSLLANRSGNGCAVRATSSENGNNSTNISSNNNNNSNTNNTAGGEEGGGRDAMFSPPPSYSSCR